MCNDTAVDAYKILKYIRNTYFCTFAVVISYDNTVDN